MIRRDRAWLCVVSRRVRMWPMSKLRHFYSGVWVLTVDGSGPRWRGGQTSRGKRALISRMPEEAQAQLKQGQDHKSSRGQIVIVVITTKTRGKKDGRTAVGVPSSQWCSPAFGAGLGALWPPAAPGSYPQQRTRRTISDAVRGTALLQRAAVR